MEGRVYIRVGGKRMGYGMIPLWDVRNGEF